MDYEKGFVCWMWITNKVLRVGGRLTIQFGLLEVNYEKKKLLRLGSGLRIKFGVFELHNGHLSPSDLLSVS